MKEIVCSNLSKKYGDFLALNKLNIEIEKGEVFGFLGPNGAGKTTTIRLLMGILVPTEGRAYIKGLDCIEESPKIKAFVGYLPDVPAFHDYLRGIEILRFVGQMHGLKKNELEKRISELLEQFGLSDVGYEFAMNYSLGMKKKLAIVCASLHNPDIYILDEPTVGLDPFAQREVENWIKSAPAFGKTVLLSSNYLEMVERTCSKIGIINKGQLLAVGSIQDLKSSLCPGGSLQNIFYTVTDSNSQ